MRTHFLSAAAFYMDRLLVFYLSQANTGYICSKVKNKHSFCRFLISIIKKKPLNIKKIKGFFFEVINSSYINANTFPFSIILVRLTMNLTFACQIILQKSDRVLFLGPIYCIRQTNILCYFHVHCKNTF